MTPIQAAKIVRLLPSSSLPIDYTTQNRKKLRKSVNLIQHQEFSCVPRKVIRWVGSNL